MILASQTGIAFADTTDQALAQILGETSVPPPEGGGGGGGGGLPSTAPALVARAQDLYQQAQAALKAGDLGTYQAKINELATVIQALQKLVGTPAPAPSGSAQPSASP